MSKQTEHNFFNVLLLFNVWNDSWISFVIQ
jgi:hypothetical protein